MHMPDLNGIDTILFDLDGTLLNVDMHQFIPAYLGGLAECLPTDVDPSGFVRNMLKRTMERIEQGSDGSQTNEDFYLQAAKEDMGIEAEHFRSGLECFYAETLPHLEQYIQPLPLAPEIITRCIDKQLRIIIATNPVFPLPVTEARLKWGRIDHFEYLHVSSYETSRHCKPNLAYFSELLDSFDLAPQQCLMVGNDTEHDLSATHLGIKTFLVDTWVIDRGGAITPDFRGNHLDLYRFLGHIPRIK
ncbi:MAG: HAD family hydrolase [Desulfuromonadaceae bacterium]|nr:HAD family hydrolase [Desulfuromonadaceae bacterium]